MTGAMRAEILTSLASVRDDVERQVARLDRYRALQAIEKTIADFPGLDDLNRSLSDIRERMQRQIEDTREVRALRAVEKIMPDLSEVLAFLAERSAASDEAPEQPNPPHNLAAEMDIIDVSGEVEQTPAAFGMTSAAPVDVVEAPSVVAPAAVEAPAMNAEDKAVVAENATSEDASSVPSVPSTQPEAGGTPSLAYSLAQMMVQATVPPGIQPLPATAPDAANPHPREVRDPSAPEAGAPEQAAERAA